jgi:hypothetical protein
MSSGGKEQEERAREFVRRLGYTEVVSGDDKVRNFLQIKVVQGTEAKCADIVGFKPSFRNAVGAIVCESKGTGIDIALVQIGNVAAALLEHFAAARRPCELFLLVYRSSLRKLDVGDSPGPNFVVGEPYSRSMRHLIHAGTTETKPAPASAAVDMKRLDVRLQKWGGQVAKLPVYVYVEP